MRAAMLRFFIGLVTIAAFRTTTCPTFRQRNASNIHRVSSSIVDQGTKCKGFRRWQTVLFVTRCAGQCCIGLCTWFGNTREDTNHPLVILALSLLATANIFPRSAQYPQCIVLVRVFHNVAVAVRLSDTNSRDAMSRDRAGANAYAAKCQCVACCMRPVSIDLANGKIFLV